MIHSWPFVSAGLVFGITAGISPGPLLALVISETLNHGFRAGLLVSLAPLITDLPIILGTLFLLSRFSRTTPILGIISLAGAAFICYLAYECFTASPLEKIITPANRSRSLQKGIIGNLLNPHPYLFWLTVGGPTLLQASKTGYGNAGFFLLLFYGGIVGCKIAVAALAHHSRTQISAGAFRLINYGLGAILLFFALLFARDGLRLLEMIGQRAL